MKKYTTILVILTLSISFLNAQKNEYRYGAIKAGLTHNYNFFAGRENTDVMFRTFEGDMLMATSSSVNYIPGGTISFNYHMDSKTEKYGFVFGIEAQNNGFRSRYTTENNLYWVVDQFRVQAVGIPLFFKFSNSNIYINQKYFIVGVEYNYYIVSQRIQRSNANPLGSSYYSHALTTNERSKSGVAAYLGFNYFIFNFQLEFWTSNFVNPDYIYTNKDKENFKPYSHIPGYNIFLKTCINIPMTRWITTKNWSAEKIRRMFNGK